MPESWHWGIYGVSVPTAACPNNKIAHFLSGFSSGCPAGACQEEGGYLGCCRTSAVANKHVLLKRQEWDQVAQLEEEEEEELSLTNMGLLSIHE